VLWFVETQFTDIAGATWLVQPTGTFQSTSGPAVSAHTGLNSGGPREPSDDEFPPQPSGRHSATKRI
jgi:hypothetical protein